MFSRVRGCMRVSVNITVRVPRQLAERMKRFSWVNWSEVIRKSIEEHLERLEEAKLVETPGELLERLEKLGVKPEDLEPLEPKTEEEMYKTMVEREWRRLSSTTQAR